MFDSLIRLFFEDRMFPWYIYKPFPYLTLLITVLFGCFVDDITFVEGTLMAMLCLYSGTMITLRWSK